MPRQLCLVAVLAVLLAATSTHGAPAGASTTPIRNVIHIVADDLRPQIGPYGFADAHTPNMDAIAKDGFTFMRAYAQQAVCAPSRNSFMSGRRPDRSLSYNFINSFRDAHPDWTTLPGMFKDSGGLALGYGKMYHPKIPPVYDGSKSWSKEALPYHNPCWNTADYPKIFPGKDQDGGLPCIPCLIDIEHYVGKKPISVANEQCETDAYEDVATVDEAIKALGKAAASGKHFYMGVGLHKPHLPFQAAPEDWAKHSIADQPLPRNPLPPKGVPDIALRFTDSLIHSSPWDPVAANNTRAAIRGYKAATTGMDRKLGKLLAEVDRLGLRNNTAIVMHGDHGWSLGEHGQWRKFTNFELDTRVPLLVRAPWINNGAGGVRVADLVELVDVLPTVAALAGLSLPNDTTPFDGRSLVDVMQQDQQQEQQQEHGQQGEVKQSAPRAAFSQYPRAVRNPKEAWGDNAIIHTDRTSFTHMGYTIRTDEWRYVAWVRYNGTSARPIWQEVVARELYDHRNETLYPLSFDVENVNLAEETQYASVVKALHAQVYSLFSGDY